MTSICRSTFRERPEDSEFLDRHISLNQLCWSRDGMAELLRLDGGKFEQPEELKTTEFFKVRSRMIPERQALFYVFEAYLLIQSVVKNGFQWKFGPWLVAEDKRLLGHRRVGLMMAVGCRPVVRIYYDDSVTHASQRREKMR